MSVATKIPVELGVWFGFAVLFNIGVAIVSEYVSERLRKAQSPEEVIEAIRAGQEVGTES